jgi:hypothetical protein
MAALAAVRGSIKEEHRAAARDALRGRREDVA